MFTLKKIKFQYIATITGVLSIICAGMNLNWATTALPYLLSPESHIFVTESDGSWLVLMPYISSVIGTFSAWKLTEIIGRRPTMLLASPFYFVSWLLIALANNLETLYSARFISGIADGMLLTSAPMYLSEIADVNVRGMLISSIIIAEIIGFILMTVIGANLSFSLTAFVACTSPVLFGITFYFMPESPYFLVIKENIDEAKVVLRKLRGTHYVEEEFEQILLTIDEEYHRKGSVLDLLLVYSNRRAVYIVLFLRFFQQFSGIMGISTYVTIIFYEASSGLSPYISTNIFFVLQLIASFIFVCAVDKIGRRPMLIISFIGVIVTLICNTTYFYFQYETSIDISNYKILPIIFLLTYIFMFGLGLGVVPLTIAGELFPVDVKAFALSLGYLYYGFLISSTIKLTQIIKDEVGLYVLFLVFSISTCIGFIYTIYFVPETKGKTFEEIQNYLKGTKKEKNIISE